MDLENNKLLNAIRDKFAAQVNGQQYPPKLEIPVLKTMTTTLPLNNIHVPELKNDTVATSSTLNSFLLSQLNDNRSRSNSAINTAGFALPRLQNSVGVASGNDNAEGLIISLSNNSNNNNKSESSRTPALVNINNDHIKSTLKSAHNQVEKQEPTIDLRTALSSADTKLTSKRTDSRSNAMDLDFEVPFIECEVFTYAPLNDDCMIDLTHMQFRHSLVAPSPFGRIVCLNYSQMSPTARKLRRSRSSTIHSFKVKHKVKQFSFDTQSPDDKVQEALNRTIRRIDIPKL